MDIFVVDEIINHRYRKGRREFLCRWEGYSSDHDSWEPAKNIVDKSLIVKYDKKRRQRGGGDSANSVGNGAGVSGSQPHSRDDSSVGSGSSVAIGSAQKGKSPKAKVNSPRTSTPTKNNNRARVNNTTSSIETSSSTLGATTNSISAIEDNQPEPIQATNPPNQIKLHMQMLIDGQIFSGETEIAIEPQH